MDEFAEYRKPDGSIDWGKKAMDELEASLQKSEKHIIELENLRAFKLADEICDGVWEMVSSWDFFAKKTVGDQIVRSADSVAANIAEGYGRYFFGEYVVFLYYARGSLKETEFWVEKARRRGLVREDAYRYLRARLEILPKELNALIRTVKQESKKWKYRK